MLMLVVSRVSQVLIMKSIKENVDFSIIQCKIVFVTHSALFKTDWITVSLDVRSPGFRHFLGHRQM